MSFPTHIAFLSPHTAQHHLLSLLAKSHSARLLHTLPSPWATLPDPHGALLAPDLLAWLDALGFGGPSPTLRTDALWPGALHATADGVTHMVCHHDTLPHSLPLPPHLARELHFPSLHAPLCASRGPLSLSLHPLRPGGPPPRRRPLIPSLLEALCQAHTFEDLCHRIMALTLPDADVLVSDGQRGAKINLGQRADLPQTQGSMLVSTQPGVLRLGPSDTPHWPGGMVHVLHHLRHAASPLAHAGACAAWSTLSPGAKAWRTISAPWNTQHDPPATVTGALAAFGELAEVGPPERLGPTVESWAARWTEAAEIHGLLGLVWLQTRHKARAKGAFDEALRLGEQALSWEALFALRLYRAWAIGGLGQTLHARHLCRELARERAPSKTLERLAKRGPLSRGALVGVRALRPDALTLCYMEHV